MWAILADAARASMTTREAKVLEHGILLMGRRYRMRRDITRDAGRSNGRGRHH